MPEKPITALVKTAQSPALARVSDQLALTDKLLTKPEEPFLIPYRKGHLWGYCDSNGTVIIECQYLNAELFINAKAKVRKWHEELVINPKNEVLSTKEVAGDDLRLEPTGDQNVHDVYIDNQLEFNDERIGVLSEGLQAFCEEDKIGFKDEYGNVKIALTYDEAWVSNDPFDEPHLKSLPVFKEGLSAVCQGEAFGYIDTAGNTKIPFIFSEAGNFSNGLASVIILNNNIPENAAYKCYINLEGNVFMPPIFDNAGDFHDGIAIVSVKKKYGCINTVGEYIIPCNYDYIYDFSEGLCVATINDKYGYMSKLGNIVIDFQYDYAYNFSEGLASVEPKTGFGFGYINQLGVIVIPTKFSGAQWFHSGVASVELGQYKSLIDKKGNLLLPFKYDYVFLERDDLALVYKGSYYNLRKVGYVNIKSGLEYWGD